MVPPFYRQLSRLLAPGGVAAVNFYGGKGQGLKQAWCRLRLVFDSGGASGWVVSECGGVRMPLLERGSMRSTAQHILPQSAAGCSSGRGLT